MNLAEELNEAIVFPEADTFPAAQIVGPVI